MRSEFNWFTSYYYGKTSRIVLPDTIVGVPVHFRSTVSSEFLFSIFLILFTKKDYIYDLNPILTKKAII